MADIISTPEDAEIQVGGDLFDASMPGMKVLATVHTLNGQSICNLWATDGARHRKLLPERVIDQKASPYMLLGELIRASSQPRLVDLVEENVHWNLAFASMEIGAKALIEQATS